LKLLNNGVDKERLLSIGKIVGAHGVKGNLKILSSSDTTSFLTPEALVIVRNKSGLCRQYKIKEADPYKRGALLSLDGITNREQAESMAGSLLMMNRSEMPMLGEGEYYWSDLIGLAVWTTENKMIGHIESIIQTGANDVYVVKGPDGETLVPALAKVVLEIDLEQHAMRVCLPEGL
jgi:16S rRNA processing protein RimM